MEDSNDNQNPGIDVERALSILSEGIRTTLALLHPADDGLAALTIATLPHGSLSTLVAMGIVKPAAQNEPAAIEISGFGREVIAACALAGLPPDVKTKIARLEEGQARRAASLGPQVPAQIELDV